MSRGDFIHLAKMGRGDFILVVKNMGGIISTYTKMTRGDSIRGDFVRNPDIPLVLCKLRPSTCII